MIYSLQSKMKRTEKNDSNIRNCKYKEITNC